MSHERTCTLQVAAMTPSTGVSENGSNIRSDRRMKSGFSRYLDTHMQQKKVSVREENCDAKDRRDTFAIHLCIV